MGWCFIYSAKCSSKVPLIPDISKSILTFQVAWCMTGSTGSQPTCHQAPRAPRFYRLTSPQTWFPAPPRRPAGTGSSRSHPSGNSSLGCILSGLQRGMNLHQFNVEKCIGYCHGTNYIFHIQYFAVPPL